jgi:hypothetical protein
MFIVLFLKQIIEFNLIDTIESEAVCNLLVWYTNFATSLMIVEFIVNAITAIARD